MTVRRVILMSLASMLLSALASVGCSGEGGDVQILNIDPRSGPLQGQNVRIIGANFRTDIGYTVYFGNKEAESVTIIDPQTLAMLAPERDEPGPVDVTVRADDGSAFRIHEGFRYEDMGGSVVEGLGGGTKTKKGKLVY